MNLSGSLVPCVMCGYRLNNRNFTEICIACRYPICNVDIGIYNAIADRDKQIELLKEEVKAKDIQITRLLNLLYIASDKNEELKESIDFLKDKTCSEDPAN